MQIMNITIPDSVSATLDLLGDPAKYKKLLADLKAMLDEINSRMEAYKSYSSADGYIADAQALKAEALREIEEAKGFSADAKQRIDKAAFALKKKTHDLQVMIAERTQALDDREKYLEGFAQGLNTRELEATRLHKEAEGMIEQAAERMRLADEVIEQYRTKAAKLRELAA